MLLDRDSLLPEVGRPKHLHGEVHSLLLQRSIAFPTLYGVLVYWICNLRPTLLNKVIILDLLFVLLLLLHKE